jgi:hypothetical protein
MRAERGTALVETALVVSLALMIIFNGLELALMGFDQSHADQHAFTAARIQAITGSATTGTNTTKTNFPPALDTYSVTTVGTLSQAVISKTAHALVMLPGAKSVAIKGEHQELVTPNAANSPLPFAFSVPTAVLQNYYAAGTSNGTAAAIGRRNMTLAQAVNTATNSQGWNGAFKQWRDHEKCFAAINFPQNYASTQTSSADTAPATMWLNYTTGTGKNGNAPEAAIYGWDTGGSGTC